MVSLNSNRFSETTLRKIVLYGLTTGAIVFLLVNRQDTAQAVTFYSSLHGPVVNPKSSRILDASADFQVSGNKLFVTLTNTSLDDVEKPSDVLTALFFRIKVPSNLTRESATLVDGSTVLFPPAAPAPVTDVNGLTVLLPPTPATDPTIPNEVGGEWAYKKLSTRFGANQGISSTGFKMFGTNVRFPGANLQGNANGNLNGLEYGITSAGDDPTTGVLEVIGKNALIKNSVQFVLSDLPLGVTEDYIDKVYFQYGNSLSDPRLRGLELDEPSTNKALPMLILGMLGFGWIVKKRPQKMRSAR